MATSVIVNGGPEECVAPGGQYEIISWDLDLTGRRLIDEICQIAAYTPTSKFAQYVMPYRNLNPAAQYRHNIRVVSVGRYRAMKNNKTGKILKTKSEISALTDFITWLESVRGKDGVILLSYESRKVVPQILLEALSKYNLLDSFSAIVKGFVNGYNIAEVKCSKTVTSFTLRTLSRLLLDKGDEMCSAVDRARLAFQVVNQLYESEDSVNQSQGGGDGAPIPVKDLATSVCQFMHAIDVEQAELTVLKGVLLRQSTLRPIFGPMISKNRRERQRCSVQKQLIAEAGLDYGLLETAFKESGKEGLSKLFLAKMTKANSKLIEELLTLLVEHFDPTQIPKPAPDIIQEGESKLESKTENVINQGKEVKQDVGQVEQMGEEKSKTDDVNDENFSSPADTATSSPINRAPTDSDTSINTSYTSVSPQSNATTPRKPPASEPAIASSPKQ